MLFNSPDFLFGFLPLSLLGYYLLGKLGGLVSRAWLCVAGLAFYTWWEPAFLIVLLCSILFNFGVSLLIGRAQGHARGLWLALGVAGNLGALGYYKYAAWLVSVLIGAGLPLSPLTGIMLPLGISFFTFTQIGYLIDVREDVAKERGFINYVLFVTFFPHLIAGPILHHREIMPQFADRAIDRFDVRHFAVGLSLFMAGLFKKTVIADGLAPMVAAGYGQGAAIGPATAWLTALAYVAQLYFDFSGYSDMAVGIARMFNVKFPLNFNSPLKAQNMGDFWQRWHMTLTRYLNAYLYNPVAMPLTRRVIAAAPGVKNPFATPRGFLLTVAIPTFWTMTLAGIWHGAGAQFVIFGLLHSAYITIYRGWTTFGPKRRTFRKGQPIDLRERVRIVGAVLLTSLCWTVSLVFFRSPDVPSALAVLRAMIGLGTGEAVGLDGAWIEAAIVALLFGVMWLAPNVYEILGEDSPALAKLKTLAPERLRWRPTTGWALATGAIGAVAVVAIGRTTEFLYFQF
jgi:alginate O-acetyltransferase complex protein AlgI